MKDTTGFWSVFFAGMYNSRALMPHLDIASDLYLRPISLIHIS
jgi:hypothetical protein